MLNAAVNWTMGAILRAGLRRYRPNATARTALLLVHVQPPFLRDDEGLTERLGRLIAFARASEMPVFWSSFGGSAGPQGFPPALDAMRAAVESGGAAETATALRAGEGDMRLPATTKLSAFYDTGLAEMLKSAGIERLVVAGPFADLGVDSTARDATERDYYTTVISDCCGAETAAARDAALKVTLPRMVQEVTPLDDWIKRVGGPAARPHKG